MAGGTESPIGRDRTHPAPRITQLENKLEHDLDGARVVLLRRRHDLPERRVGRVDAVAPRYRELRAVEGVDRLEPELDLLSLRQQRVLQHREIEGVGG